MGNGPGGLQEYWDLIENNANLTGGYVWEWCNHGVSYGNKKERYGGDFGEFIHDANFCMDGIVNSDRSLKPGSLEMKKVYQPLKFIRDCNVIKIFNKNYFENAVGKLKIRDNNEEFDLSICIVPQTEIQIPCSKNGTVYVEFVRDGDDFVCAHEQFYDNSFVKTNKVGCEVKFTENARFITVKAGDNEYIVDKLTAQIDSVKVVDTILPGIKFNTWRAPTDNDERNFLKIWQLYGVQNPIITPKTVNVSGNSITFDISAGGMSFRPFLNANLTYNFYENGVSVSIKYEQLPCVPKFDANFNMCSKNGLLLYIPRIGFTMNLDKSFENIKYLALNSESYSDLCAYAVKGEYKTTVDSQYYNYYKPQETGSHFLSDYAEISNGKITIRVEGMKSFSALPYTANELTEVKHFDELPPKTINQLSVDYFMSGIGSNTCGPTPTPLHRVPKEGSGEIFFIFNKI